jgi:ankyrin repeat protein
MEILLKPFILSLLIVGIFPFSLSAQEATLTDENELSSSDHASQGSDLDNESAPLFLEYGDINETDDQGYTPLHLATAEGNSPAVQALLEAGADASIEENEALFTPLHTAIMSNFPECVRLLLLHGASSCAKTYFGVSPLQMAFLTLGQLHNTPSTDNTNTEIEKRELIVHYLLDNEQIDVNEKWEHGLTALHVAATYDKTELARKLIDRGADPYSANLVGITAANSPLIQQIVAENALLNT